MAEPVSSTSFREALAAFASGVTIVTARSGTALVGMTVSAFSSASLDPPLVLVCIGRGASAHDALVRAPRFGVSILAEGQAWIAEQLARHREDRFRGVPLRGGEGDVVPVVDGALVQLELEHHALHDAGDHTILVGEVTRVAVAPGRPLLHFGRRFGGFATESVRSQADTLRTAGEP